MKNIRKVIYITLEVIILLWLHITCEKSNLVILYIFHLKCNIDYIT